MCFVHICSLLCMVTTLYMTSGLERCTISASKSLWSFPMVHGNVITLFFIHVTYAVIYGLCSIYMYEAKHIEHNIFFKCTGVEKRMQQIYRIDWIGYDTTIQNNIFFHCRCSMSEEDGAKLYDIYPHISDVVGSQCLCFCLHY